MKYDSNYIIMWLREHDLININLLEKKCGLTRSTIQNALPESSNRSIPERHIDCIANELKKYGLDA